MEERNNNSKGLRAFLIIAAVVAVIGVTYAFITIVLTGEKTNTITGGSLQLTLNDTDTDLGNGEGETISIDNAFPVTDAVGKESNPYTFKLTSAGDKDASYTVFLDPDDFVTGENRMADTQVKAYLTNLAGDELLAPTVVDSLPVKTGTEETATLKSRVLYSGILTARSSETFQLRLWINQDAEADVMGKQYSTKISIDAIQVPEYAVTVSYTETVTTPPVVEGGEATTEEVARIASAAVFKGGTATITLPTKEGSTSPTVTCTGTQATLEQKEVDGTQKLVVTATNVTEHTQCTINY